jgi:flavin reductase (DIM6/NTAB) family NADH-FMN oxidoreductase RutF
MNQDHKKMALRMIPYGLYVITSVSDKGEIAASTIDWLTQTSFTPPLIAAGIKIDSSAYKIIKQSKHFALNILTKGQQNLAVSFFKKVTLENNLINGHKFHADLTGSPILDDITTYIECKLIEIVNNGDHSVFIGEVLNASVNRKLSGRPDDHTLTLKDLGEKVFYGG